MSLLNLDPDFLVHLCPIDSFVRLGPTLSLKRQGPSWNDSASLVTMAEVALALKICVVALRSVSLVGLNRRETDAKQDQNKQHIDSDYNGFPQLSMFFSDHAVEVLLNRRLLLGIWWRFIHKSQIRFSKSGVKSGKDIPHLRMWPLYPMVLRRDWYGRGREWGSEGSQKKLLQILMYWTYCWGGWLSSFRDKNFNRGFPDQKLNLLVYSWAGSHRWDVLRSKKMTGRRPTSLGHSDLSNIH